MAVVDASVVVDWVAPRVDPSEPAARLLQRFATSSEHLVAPRLLLQETANALLTGVRRGRWSGAEADASFATLSQMPVRLVDPDEALQRAWDLSRRYDEHPLYDMVYLAVAQSVGDTLYTADAALVARLGLDTAAAVVLVA
jgi:predicted nucleic acid-binding protein